MNVQDDIQFYYRRAAEARARGKEALAQTMENYARNLEAGIYDDDGRGFDMAASNQRWAQKEAEEAARRKAAEEAARRKAAEEQLYASRPRRSSGGGSGGGRGSRPSFPSYGNSNPENAGYDVPPMDYAQVGTRRDSFNQSYDPGSEDFNEGSWEEARQPAPTYISRGDYWDRGSNSDRKKDRSSSDGSWLNKPLW